MKFWRNIRSWFEGYCLSELYGEKWVKEIGNAADVGVYDVLGLLFM